MRSRGRKTRQSPPLLSGCGPQGPCREAPPAGSRPGTWQQCPPAPSLRVTGAHAAVVAAWGPSAEQRIRNPGGSVGSGGSGGAGDPTGPAPALEPGRPRAPPPGSPRNRSRADAGPGPGRGASGLGPGVSSVGEQSRAGPTWAGVLESGSGVGSAADRDRVQARSGVRVLSRVWLGGEVCIRGEAPGVRAWVRTWLRVRGRRARPGRGLASGSDCVSGPQPGCGVRGPGPGGAGVRGGGGGGGTRPN